MRVFAIILIITITSCSNKLTTEPVITIVNIGYSNRLDLGTMIGILKKSSPKIIGLDFHLVPDSLGNDTNLVNELASTNNIVQIVALHSSSNLYNDWDSLESSHPKFHVTKHGFANITTEDSVSIPELPLSQEYDSKPVFAFSYVVAKNSFGVRDKYKNPNYDEVTFRLEHLGKNYNLIQNFELLNVDFNDEFIDGKIVLMGFIGEKDAFYQDESKTQKVSGTEIHAAYIEELLDTDSNERKYKALNLKQ